MSVAALDIDEERARQTAAAVAELGVGAEGVRVDVGDPRSILDAARRVARAVRRVRPSLRERRRAAVRQHRPADRRRLDLGARGQRHGHHPHGRRVPAPDPPAHGLAPHRDHGVVGRAAPRRPARRIHHEQVRGDGIRRDAAARARTRGHRRDARVPGRNDHTPPREQRVGAPRCPRRVDHHARRHRGDAGQPARVGRPEHRDARRRRARPATAAPRERPLRAHARYLPRRLRAPPRRDGPCVRPHGASAGRSRSLRALQRTDAEALVGHDGPAYEGIGERWSDPGERVAVDVVERLVATGDDEHPLLLV